MNFVLLNGDESLLGVLLISAPSGGQGHSCPAAGDLHRMELGTPHGAAPLSEFIRDHAGSAFAVTVTYGAHVLQLTRTTGDGWAFEAHAGGRHDGWSITRGTACHRGAGYLLHERPPQRAA